METTQNQAQATPKKQEKKENFKSFAEIVKKHYDSKLNERKVLQRSCYQYNPEELLDGLTLIGQKVCPGFRLDDDNHMVFGSLIRWAVFNQNIISLESNAQGGFTALRGDCHKGIYLAGGTGTGKTIALKVLGEFLMVLHSRIKYGDRETPLCLEANEYLAADICDEYANTGDIRRFKDARVLVIQDLGAEPLETMYMGNRLSVLRNILESRGEDKNLLTFITSNYRMDGPEIVKRYGDRVASRLRSMCNFLYLGGADRRK